MATHATTPLAELYEADETAWLEAMADLLRDGQLDELDLPHLAEYLTDMARRDRREVRSRLVILLAHLLKSRHQPDHETASWRRTIAVQRMELRGLLESGVLRSHAEAVFADAYTDAVELASAETGLNPSEFPAASPFTLDEALRPGIADA